MTDKSILVSQFIDDELSLNEKAEFVREINSSNDFCAEALGMIETEIEFSEIDITPPKIAEIPVKRQYNYTAYASFTALAASLMVMVKVFLLTPEPSQEAVHRFVVYVPDAQNVAVAGSFNQWQAAEMQKVGDGYWQINMPLKKGEYTYSYIVDGNTQIPDPTIPAKQDDGFGGENSVLSLGDDI